MKDWSNETAIVQFRAVDYNALTYATYLVAIGSFRAALSGTGLTGISQGVIIAERQNLFVDDFARILPVDENILRGRKWVVRYQDNVTFKVHRMEIPTARPTPGLLIANTDRANLLANAWVDFRTAFVAIARSPEDNFVTILSARLVGRKLRTIRRG